MRKNRLSEYIDHLNKEEIPKEHREPANAKEYDRLTRTVRRIKSLKEPVLPGCEFEEKLLTSVTGRKVFESREVPGTEFHDRRYASVRQNRYRTVFRRTLITVSAMAAAAVILFTVPGIPFVGKQPSIIRAMEQAMEEVGAYHGIIEVTETNGLGETMVQARREVWANSQGNYWLKELTGYQKNMISVNNGEARWQLRPEEKTAYLFPSFPDPYRFTFELGKEVEGVRSALTVKKVGEEVITGREAVILEVTPDGGDTYRLWVDQETDLPLQKHSAMRNELQMKVTYTEITFVEEIPEELLQYSLPVGYTEIDTDPEQVLLTMEEAGEAAGFLPIIPDELPQGYDLIRISYLSNSEVIKLTYRDNGTGKSVIILQSKKQEELKPDPMAILGAVSKNLAEILQNFLGQTGVTSIRWLEGDMEYRVYGDLPPEVLGSFVKSVSKGELILPIDEKEFDKPQIEVPYDLETEQNDQKSVDAGHSPWKLDPAFVAQVFVNLQISPEGIIGEYKIPYDAVKIIENNGISAIAEIDSEDTIARKVYMKRLVRQDDTGIWTVVGYDPVKK